MSFTHEETAFELGKIIWSKTVWIEQHSKNWPQNDVERVKREIAVLEHAHSMFQRAAERDKGKVA